MLMACTEPEAAQKPDCEASIFVLQDLEQERSVPSPDGAVRVVLGVKSQDQEVGWLRVEKSGRLIRRATVRLTPGPFAGISCALATVRSSSGTPGHC
jgi:hypothetical protein